MSRTIKNAQTIQELRRIAQQAGGVLKPEDVVKSAERKTSPLHRYFDWDDTEAAREWRLHQARQLINVCVELLPSPNAKKVQRVFVSLRSDRKQGGYRPMVKVLATPNLREELIADALEEMKYFQEKYKSLKELAIVFRAMTTAQRRISNKENKRRAA
jgi:hypothetical protein